MAELVLETRNRERQELRVAHERGMQQAAAAAAAWATQEEQRQRELRPMPGFQIAAATHPQGPFPFHNAAPGLGFTRTDVHVQRLGELRARTDALRAQLADAAYFVRLYVDASAQAAQVGVGHPAVESAIREIAGFFAPLAEIAAAARDLIELQGRAATRRAQRHGHLLLAGPVDDNSRERRTTDAWEAVCSQHDGVRWAQDRLLDELFNKGVASGDTARAWDAYVLELRRLRERMLMFDEAFVKR